MLIAVTVEIHSGAKLSPPVIAVAAHDRVRLTVDDLDGRGHTVLLDGRRVHISAGGHGRLTTPRLGTGSFPIEIDGHVRGRLTAGSRGGP